MRLAIQTPLFWPRAIKNASRSYLESLQFYVYLQEVEDKRKRKDFWKKKGLKRFVELPAKNMYFNEFVELVIFQQNCRYCPDGKTKTFPIIYTVHIPKTTTQHSRKELKFIYYEKATKFWRNLQILFGITCYCQEKVWRFHHILVAFSEFVNFTSCEAKLNFKFFLNPVSRLFKQNKKG